jgi:hypothetical protein
MSRTTWPTLSGAALALVLSTLPAAAQDSPSLGRDYRSWGTTTASIVRLMSQEDGTARVVFLNRLTVGNPLTMDFRLEIDGLSVDVSVSNGEGDLPDIITVRPPLGFMAEPSTLSVEENDRGFILIRAMPMS